jgi:LysM repeat protein
VSQKPTRAQTLRWDIFKGIVALILLILLILLLLRGCGTLGISPVVPIPAPSEEATEATESATEPLTGSLGTPTASHAVPEILSPTDGSEIASTTITLEGTGEIGSTLDVLDGDEVISSVVVGSDGSFSTELSPNLGDHLYTVREANSGLVSSPVTVSITAAVAGSATATSAPTVSQPTSTSGEGDHCDYTGVVIKGYKPDKFHYVVGTCDTLSSIAAALGIKLSALIAANPQIKNPDLIYPGQVLNLP